MQTSEFLGKQDWLAEKSRAPPFLSPFRSAQSSIQAVDSVGFAWSVYDLVSLFNIFLKK